jgi:hypothetical protein
LRSRTTAMRGFFSRRSTIPPAAITGVRAIVSSHMCDFESNLSPII